MERIIRVPETQKAIWVDFVCFFLKELESKRPNWSLVKTIAGAAYATRCFSSMLVAMLWCFDDSMNALFIYLVFHFEA